MTFKLKLLAFGLALVAVDATSITTDCTSITLQNTWLVANCSTGQSSTHIQSAVYLPTKITNVEGVLQWKINGAYENSCTDCKIIGGATLNCQCFVTGKASQKNATIDLEDHIQNYKGHLLSDVAGPPSVPTTSSDINVPSDMSWSLYEGGLSCWLPAPKSCSGPTNPSNLDCPASPTYYSTDGTPYKCFVLPIPAPFWEQFASFKGDSPSKAWNFVLYDNINCTGQPIETVTPDKYGTCDTLSKNGLGIAILPLWNADIS